MLTSEAQVQTDRPTRYLVQLCRHASQIAEHLQHGSREHDGGAAPPEVQHVESSDTYGVVRLDWGEWIMRATPGRLTLRAKAPDEENLRRIETLVAGRLEALGRRDHLTVNWRRLAAQ